ncbi:MAG: hypothetical protein AB7G08_31865, partial [Hyphomicrobiaceae bacterium]
AGRGSLSRANRTAPDPYDPTANRPDPEIPIRHRPKFNSLLGRNVAFIATLLESGVEIIAVDMPGADRSWLQLAAVWAEREAMLIALRTREALARAKADGVALGGYRGVPITASNAALGRVAQAVKAQEYASAFAPVIEELRGLGITSTPAIAAELNARSIPTPRGGRWHAASVARLMARTA